MTDIAAVLQQQTERQQTLQAEIDRLTGDIAAALLSGQDVSALQQRQATKQMELAALPALLARLQEAQRQDERQQAIAAYHALKARVQVEAEAVQVLDKQIAPLEANLAPLADERRRRHRLQMDLASNLAHAAIRLQNEFGVEELD